MFASVVQASFEVFELATKGMMVGEIEPMIAFKINWSYRIQIEWAGFGVVVLLLVIVAEGQGLDPLMYPNRS